MFASRIAFLFSSCNPAWIFLLLCCRQALLCRAFRMPLWLIVQLLQLASLSTFGVRLVGLSVGLCFLPEAYLLSISLSLYM